MKLLTTPPFTSLRPRPARPRTCPWSPTSSRMAATVGRAAGGDDVALAATRVGVGRRDESGRGKEEGAVTMAAGILSRGGGAVDDATTGGQTAMEVRGEEVLYYPIAINIIAN